MHRAHWSVLSLVVIGCSSGEAPVVPVSPRGSATSETHGASASSAQNVSAKPVEEEAAALDDELIARLANEKLVGFVVADGRALFFATESAARASDETFQPEPARLKGVREPDVAGDGLRVLEDLGEVVRVSTERVEDLGAVDSRFKLELFVRRSALLPVLRTPRKESFQDGTAVLLREGLVLSPLRGGSRPARKLLAKVLTTPIDAADVGLSFVSPSQRPQLDPVDRSLIGAELGCDRASSTTGHWKLRIRVDDRAVMIDEENQARGAREGDHFDLGGGGLGHQYSFRCTFGGSPSTYEDVEDGALVLNGREVGRSSDLPLDDCSGQVSARRVAKEVDAAFVTVAIPRAELRVRTTMKSLIEGGGCGMAAGFNRPTVKAVKFDAITYFPDGTKAGVHTARATKLRLIGDATMSGKRTCVAPPYLTTQLCFDAADLVEVED
jgi:hypothetical protein